jgi:alpha-tubulin suppressor-like RCC1 family protein
MKTTFSKYKIFFALFLIFPAPKLFCQSISAVTDFSQYVCSDGKLESWGSNMFGQFGNNTTIDRSFPSASLMSDVAQISGGIGFGIALKTDGSVWTWGFNEWGQLGDGTTITSTLCRCRPLPTPISSLSNVIAVSSGGWHNLILKADSTVWSWGNNSYGAQLGDGTYTNKSSPIQVLGLSSIIEISAGHIYSMALKADGTVWMWGDNSFGQLGDGTNINRTVPNMVANLSNVVSIATGYYQSYAVKSDGSLWAWGNNNYGQLGDSTTINKSVPVRVKNLTDVVKVSSGLNHTIALKSDGSVWVWGRNDLGQLGDSTFADKLFPSKINGINNVSDISAGSYHNLAIEKDTEESVWCWGYNLSGQLGDSSIIKKNYPIKLFIGCENSQITSVNSLTLKDLRIYPNPSAGEFWCEIEGNSEQINVKNILGEIVYQNIQHQQKGDLVKINISQNAKGTYFLEIYGRYGKTVKRLIVN